MRFLVFGLLFLSAVYFSDSYSIAKRAVREDRERLGKRVGELRSGVERELARLRAAGKVTEAVIIEELEKEIIAAEAKLKISHPTTEAETAAIAALEAEVKILEAKLAAEIKKSGGVVKRAVREDRERVGKRVGELRSEVERELARLKAAGKVTEAVIIEELEKEIIAAEAKLKISHPTTEAETAAIAALEAEVKILEAKLAAEIKKSGGVVKRAVREDRERVGKRVGELRSGVERELARLRAAGKVTEAVIIEELEKEIIAAEAKLKISHPTTEAETAAIAALEAEVKILEAKLAAEIKKSGGVVKRAVREDRERLGKRVGELRSGVERELARLRAAGKVSEALIIEELEKEIIAAEAKLKISHPTTEAETAAIAVLEAEVKILEAKLAAEIKKSGGVVKRAVREDRERVGKRVGELRTGVERELARLRAAGKVSEAVIIEELEKEIIAAEAKLKISHPTTEAETAAIAALEAEVKILEAKLAAEIKKSSGGVF